MNLRRFWAVARKESIHIRRDPRSLGLAVGIPMLMLFMFGYALNLDVDRVPFVVWDQSNSVESRDFVARFTATPYFALRGTVTNYAEVEREIDKRDAWLALILPPDFSGQLTAGRVVPVQAIVDGADSNTAAIVLGYTQTITLAHNQKITLEQIRRLTGATAPPALDLRTRIWFNADLESKNYIVPGIMAVIMGLIAALLTSLTIAREWERGTMEQLISTPVRPAELILGKLLPYFVIGLANMVIAVLMAVFVFQVPLRGSVPLLFALGSLFIVATLAQGIFISAVARQQLMASQLAMVSTFMPAFLLSGFTFAIANMPTFIQGLTYIIPARYFVAVVKGIFLRGVGLKYLWPEALFLFGFAVIVLVVAIRKTPKRLV
jgi:ABC-2 type transport system permease protein